jgi:hypothetical protein
MFSPPTSAAVRMRGMKRYAAQAVAILGFVLLAVGLVDESRRLLATIGAALLIGGFKIDMALKRAAGPGRESGG